MDMTIDTNDSAIRRLSALNNQIESIKKKARSPKDVYRDFRLTTNSLTTVHLNAILRIYGNEHGHQVLEMLRKNPVKTIPVLLVRLVAKAEELRKARMRLSEGWNQIYRDSFAKALDYRADKRRAETQVATGPHGRGLSDNMGAGEASVAGGGASQGGDDAQLPGDDEGAASEDEDERPCINDDDDAVQGRRSTSVDQEDSESSQDKPSSHDSEGGAGTSANAALDMLALASPRSAQVRKLAPEPVPTLGTADADDSSNPADEDGGKRAARSRAKASAKSKGPARRSARSR